VITKQVRAALCSATVGAQHGQDAAEAREREKFLTRSLLKAYGWSSSLLSSHRLRTEI